MTVVGLIFENAPDFVAVAERFLNVPYFWGGKTSLGLDCSALVQLSLAAAGVAAPRDSDSLFGGEFWLWERRDGGVGRRGADRPLPRRVGAPRSDRAAISSPTA